MPDDDTLSDEAWTRRCVDRMVELDPELQPVLAEELATELCARARWRAMVPESAAQTLFDFDAKR